MVPRQSQSVEILAFKQGEILRQEDNIAIEEPLEILLVHHDKGIWKQESLGITMRTPGDDESLAVGLLRSEGIIKDFMDIQEVESIRKWSPTISQQVRVLLKPEISFSPENYAGSAFRNASCGVCGSASILEVEEKFGKIPSDTIRIPVDNVFLFSEQLLQKQKMFRETGGIHAVGLFDVTGNCILCCEDIGRHNAMDKIIGRALTSGMQNFSNYCAFLSGRASFEMVQKATSIGIPIIVSVGAPSSLAMQLAKELNITLIGFLKTDSFNIYSHPERVTRRDEN